MAAALWLVAELGWGYAAAGCPGAGVEPPVPDGDDQVRVADGQGAGEVDGVGSAQCAGTCELAGVALYRRVSSTGRVAAQ